MSSSEAPWKPRSLKTAWSVPFSLDRWLWLWTGSQLLTLSLASGKHHHYLIYALPPFAVWAAEGVRWYTERLRSLWAWRIWRVGGTIIAIALTVAGAVLVSQRNLMSLAEALAVGGFVVAGLFLTGLALHLRRDALSTTAFAVTLAGVLLYVCSMWTAGITQGVMWLATNPDGTLTYPFIDSLIAIKGLYFLRWLSGVLILCGMVVMAWNLWHTAAAARARLIKPIPVPVPEPEPQQVPAPLPAYR